MFVGLGGNVGDVLKRIPQAIAELSEIPRTCLLAKSSLYRTVPVGIENQPDFVNAVAKLRTDLSAKELLAELQLMERRHGRVRREKNGPRTLDLDLLVYDGLVSTDPSMMIPHPRMHERAFVLLPLSEIAPESVIPGHGPIGALLAKLPAQGVTRLHAA
ncbi:MAG: 2-amino-4-hydroxy-6-hydroxymethyldihydropteridine diphosphokinase [Burkholderiales bacterium]